MKRKQLVETETEEMSFAEQVEEYFEELKKKKANTHTTALAVYSIGNVIYAAARFRPHPERIKEEPDWLLDAS